MPAQFGQTTAYDCYLNDVELIGRISDFSDPDHEWETVDHNTLGASVMLSTPGRTLKAMTGKFSIDFPSADLFPALYDPTKFLKFRLVPFVDIWNQDGIDTDKSFRLIVNITVAIRKVGGGLFKTGEKMRGDAEYSMMRYVKGPPGQTPWREIDVMNQVNNKDGQPVWPQY